MILAGADGVRTEDLRELGPTILVLGLVVAGFYLLQLAKWCYERGWFFGGYRSLFGELCRAHKLNRKQRQLLVAAADHLRIDSPAILFMRPDLLRSLAAASGRDREALVTLANHIYRGVDWQAALPSEEPPASAAARAKPIVTGALGATNPSGSPVSR